MPDQYTAISKTYEATKSLPHNIMINNFNRTLLPPLQNLHILDLACGTGYYSIPFLRSGAASVLGIDISGGMISEAKAALALHPEYAEKCRFLIGDCTDPDMFSSLGLEAERGTFDLVHGAWLLNYAFNRAELLAMWRNICTALKPGGRFVGIVPNVLDRAFDFEHPFSEEKYGSVYEALEKVEGGWRAGFRAPSCGVEFDFFILNEEGLYEKCAKEAGMRDVKFEVPVVGQEEENKWGVGFWDEYRERPSALVCTAVK